MEPVGRDAGWLPPTHDYPPNHRIGGQTMRILSNKLKYNHLIRNAVIDMVVDQEGRKVPMVVKPQIFLEFSQNGILRYDHQYAAQHWGSHNRDPHDGTADNWGAHPEPREGVVDGQVHLSWRPWMSLSVFDTENMEPGEPREFVEAYFAANPQGQDWIVVTKEALKPPWPSYDEMQWKKIALYARDLGLTAEAFAYESARDEPRKGVLDALQEEHVAVVEEAQEDAALTVIVP